MARNILESMSRRLQDFSGSMYSTQLEILQKANKGEFQSAFAMQAKIFTDQTTLIQDLVTDCCDIYQMFQRHIETQVNYSKTHDSRVTLLEKKVNQLLANHSQSIVIDVETADKDMALRQCENLNLVPVKKDKDVNEVVESLPDVNCEFIRELKKKLHEQIEVLLESHAIRGRHSLKANDYKLQNTQRHTSPGDQKCVTRSTHSRRPRGRPRRINDVSVTGIIRNKMITDRQLRSKSKFEENKSQRGRKRKVPKALEDFYLDGDEIADSQRPTVFDRTLKRHEDNLTNSNDDFNHYSNEVITRSKSPRKLLKRNVGSPSGTRKTRRCVAMTKSADDLDCDGKSHEALPDGSYEIVADLQERNLVYCRNGFKRKLAVDSKVDLHDEIAGHEDCARKESSSAQLVDDDYCSDSSVDDNGDCVIQEHSYSTVRCSHRHGFIKKSVEVVTPPLILQCEPSMSPITKSTKEQELSPSLDEMELTSSGIATILENRMTDQSEQNATEEVQETKSDAKPTVQKDILAMAMNGLFSEDEVSHSETSVLDCSISSDSSLIPEMRTLRIRLLDVFDIHRLWETMRDYIANDHAVLLKIPVDKEIRKQVLMLCNICNLNFKIGARQIIILKHKDTTQLTVNHLGKIVKAFE